MRSRGILLSSFAGLLLLVGLFLSLRHKVNVPTRIIPMKSETLALAYSTNGQFLATGQQIIISGQDRQGNWAYAAGEVHLFNTQSYAETKFPFIKQAYGLNDIIMSGPVSSLIFSPNGRWLLAGSSNDVLGTMEAATGRWTFSVRAERSGKRYKPVGFTADSREVVYADITEDRTVEREDSTEAWKRAKHTTNLIFRQSDTGKIVKQLKNILKPGEWPSQFQMLHRSNLIAVGTKLGDDSRTFGVPATIVLIDVNKGTRIESMPLNPEANSGLYASSINEMSVSATGNCLAAVTSDGCLGIWDMQVRQTVILPMPEGKHVWGIAISDDGKSLAGVNLEGTVLIWNIPERKLTQSWETRMKWIREIAFAPNGKTLATTGEDHAVKLWAVE